MTSYIYMFSYGFNGLWKKPGMGRARRKMYKGAEVGIWGVRGNEKRSGVSSGGRVLVGQWSAESL